MREKEERDKTQNGMRKERKERDKARIKNNEEAKKMKTRKRKKLSRNHKSGGLERSNQTQT